MNKTPQMLAGQAQIIRVKMQDGRKVYDEEFVKILLNSRRKSLFNTLLRKHGKDYDAISLNMTDMTAL